MPTTVRRVHVHEWELVRDLRMEALLDPVAPIAFLESYDQAAAQPDEFWVARAENSADGGRVAQFLALAAPGDDAGGTGARTTAADVAGTVTVLVQEAGDVDGHGRAVVSRRALLVGVYVRPGHRGARVIDALVETAARWSAEQGVDALHLGVHGDNARAQGAYRRAGFRTVGDPWVGVIGPEIDMVLPLSAGRATPAAPSSQRVDA